MGKYDKYVVQTYKPGVPKELIDNDKHCKILWMDETTIHGAPYMEVLWYYKPYDFGPNSHYHEEDEFLGFVGSDPSDPTNLHARVRVTIDGEDIYLTKSSMVYIPARVPHSVFAIEEMDRPILHFSGGPNQINKKLGNTLGFQSYEDMMQHKKEQEES